MISMCVCVPPRLFKTSSVIWTAYNWLNKFYSFYVYVVAVVSIISRCSLSIDVRHGNQLNKRNVALFMLSIHFNNNISLLYISSEMEHFSYKGGPVWCGTY